MIEIRPIREDELEALAVVGTPGGSEFAQQVRDRLADGSMRPEWCVTAAVDGEPLARVAFALDEPPANAPTEMYLFGLALDWERPAARDAALAMLRRTLPGIAAGRPPIDARVNPEVHPDFDKRRTLLEEAGFWLFHEKAGYFWQADRDAPPPRSSRLTFRALRDVGTDAFIAVMANGPVGTLDRNDRYYHELTGPVGWATVMMGFRGEGDDETWKVAYDADGRPVGYVMLSAFDEGATGTIAHIGVVPEQRGRGYVNDLLAEATHDAVSRGFRGVLSDADVLNVPMGAALERAGHRRGVRPWHVWHYRYPPPE